MEVRDTHLEIIDPETKKKSIRKELSQSVTIGTIDEIANEINARPNFAAKRSTFRFAVINMIEQALFSLQI